MGFLDPKPLTTAGLDAATAAKINTPASATATALSATILTKVDEARPIKSLMHYFATKPWFASHMGGETLYPENSLEAFRASAAAGFALEMDVKVLPDGTQVIWHGYSPETKLSGGITDFTTILTRDQWKQLTIAPVITGGRRGTVCTLAEVLDEFGGVVPLLIEIKHGNPDAAIAMYQDLVARGLQESVIVLGNTYWQPEAAVTYGLHGMYLNGNNPGSGTWKSAANLVASGIEYAGFSSVTTGADMQAFYDAGLKICTYTYNTRAEILAQPSIVSGFTCADPWQASGRVTPKIIEKFDSGHLWPTATRMVHASNKITLDPTRNGVRIDHVVADPTPQGIRLGQFGVGPVKGTYRFKLQFLGPAVDQNRYCHFFVGSMPNNQPYALHGDTTIQAYFGTIRRNGTFALNKRVTGAATETNLATHTGTADYAAAATEGGVFEFELEVTDTAVKLTDLTRGIILTSADTGYRGTDAILSFSAMNTSAVLSDVRVIR